MTWPVWHVRGWVGRAGILAFLATLAVVIPAASLRLHLWFTSRTYPTELATQRAHVGRWLRAADYGFAGVMVVTGVTIAEAHNGWGALFVSMGVGAALVFLIVEPVTARSAFGSSRDG
jgi:hypothetical protein